VEKASLLDKHKDKLTDEERSQAGEVGVYRLNAHGTDSHGWPDSFLCTAAYCLTAEEAWLIAKDLPLKPGWDEFRVSGPVSLIELYEYGNVSTGRAREFLKMVGTGKKYKSMSKPLVSDEKDKAANIDVYYVWYEDQFHYGGDRDSFPVAVCFSREEAEAEINSRVRDGSAHRLQAGYDGLKVVGPCNLASDCRPDIVREVLRRKEAGLSGPVGIY
jgi:hypothetical protein